MEGGRRNERGKREREEERREMQGRRKTMREKGVEKGAEGQVKEQRERE